MKKIAISFFAIIASASMALASETCLHIEEFAMVSADQGFQIINPKQEIIRVGSDDEVEGDDSYMEPVIVTYVDKKDELVEAVFVGEEVCYKDLNLRLIK